MRRFLFRVLPALVLAVGIVLAAFVIRDGLFRLARSMPDTPSSIDVSGNLELSGSVTTDK
jgi:hypothetical protein